MSFELAARLLGGIGLFLLGMRLMTEGLRVAAGPGEVAEPSRGARQPARIHPDSRRQDFQGVAPEEDLSIGAF